MLIVLLFGGLSIWISGCSNAQTEGVNTKQADTSALQVSSKIYTTSNDKEQQLNSMTDERDGETYATVIIGEQTWMAENLRYNASLSKLNPENPSTNYGRLYDAITVQTVCPNGWHLPSDWEWNKMEMALGMSEEDVDKTFWRGEHGLSMKSTEGWVNDGNGTNSSGFNAYPAGYFSLTEWGGANGFGGLGTSVGFWASMGSSDWPIAKVPNNRVWLRFVGAPLKGVNRFDDEKSSGFALACRCVKD